MDENNEQFVAYFLPTSETLTKRKDDEEQSVSYQEGEEYVEHAHSLFPSSFARFARSATAPHLPARTLTFAPPPPQLHLLVNLKGS